MDKDIRKLLDSINDINPLATYLSDSTLSTPDKWIDTGSLVLNALISGSLFGGIPMGRLTMLAGESGCGKTFIGLNYVASAQRMGLIPIIFDTENAIDASSAMRFGIDLDRVKYIPIETAEKTRNTVYKLLKGVVEAKKEGQFAILIDSLAMLESEIQQNRMEKENTAADMGSFAKAVKSLLKVCTSWGAKSKTPIVITNHIYDDPSAMYTQLIKNVPGGKSAVYLPSVIVQMAKSPAKTKDTGEEGAIGGKDISGVYIRALTAKNRFVKPFLTGELYLSFAKGLDKYYGLGELASDLGVIVRKGSVYEKPDGTKLGYMKNFTTDLYDNFIIPGIEEKIKKEWAFSSNEEKMKFEQEFNNMELEDDQTNKNVENQLEI